MKVKKHISMAALLVSFLLTTNVQFDAKADGPPVPLAFKSYFSTATDINQLTVKANGNNANPPLPSIITLPETTSSVLRLIPPGSGYVWNSAFINEKVDISRVQNKGISSFIEFDVYKGSTNVVGDSFQFILSKEDKQITQRFTDNNSMNNSLTINLSYYNAMNGLTDLTASIFDRINGGVTNRRTNYVAIDPNFRAHLLGISANQKARNYKFWFDYNKTSQTLEIRLRFDASYERPSTPTVIFSNINADFLGDSFYAGIAATTGAYNFGIDIRQWLFANRSLDQGIDPTLDPSAFFTDATPPTNPTVTPTRTDTGWRLNPVSTDDSMTTITYEYQLDGNTFTTQPSDFVIPDGTRQVKIRAIDIFNKVSAETTANFYQITFQAEGATQPEVKIWHPEGVQPLFPNFSKTGYTVLGFTTVENNANVDVLSSYSISSDTTLYAKWAINQVEINAVIGLINAIVTPITFASETAIEEALAAYNNLIPAQQQGVTNHDLLIGYEEAFTALFVPINQVIDLIDPLDQVITLNDKQDILAARAAYNALTTEQKTYVTNLQVLIDAEAALLSLEQTQAVREMIEDLKQPNDITLDDKEELEAAREAFDALTSSQQANIANELKQKLFDAEAALLALEQTQDVIDILENLPDLKSITLDDQAAIEAARAAFDTLTPSQQANISDQLKQKLLDAETELNALLNPASSFSLLPFHLLSGLIIGVIYFLKTKKEVQ